MILVCYVAHTAKYLTYLLKSTEVTQIWEFDNLHMTQSAKIIVGFVANVGNVFYPTFRNIFLFSPRFLFSSQRLLHLWNKPTAWKQTRLCIAHNNNSSLLRHWRLQYSTYTWWKNTALTSEQIHTRNSITSLGSLDITKITYLRLLTADKFYSPYLQYIALCVKK